MSVFLSLVKKEALHILRDRRTVAVTVIMPLVLLLLFGFAISTEVNNVRIVVAADGHDDRTHEIMERIDANGYFTLLGLGAPLEAETMLRKGEADALLVLRPDAGKLAAQIMLDASNPVVSQAAGAYITAVVNGSTDSVILNRTLYNPQLKSAYNFVPGIMGMIFILICAIMTSVSIVNEKESGSMDLLLISPVRPGWVVFGKLVPYFILSCTILAVMLVMAYTVLGLPSSGSIMTVIAVSLLYIVLSLSVGLLVSTLVSNQVSALIVSAVLFMIPVIMLSGMIFPIDNMPAPLQWLSGVIPARWYIASLRKLMIQQLGVGAVIGEVVILAVMTAAILGLAVKNFNSKR